LFCIRKLSYLNLRTIIPVSSTLITYNMEQRLLILDLYYLVDLVSPCLKWFSYKLVLLHPLKVRLHHLNADMGNIPDLNKFRPLL